MVRPFLVRCRPKQLRSLHVLLSNVAAGQRVAANDPLLKMIVEYLHLGLATLPEAVAAALEDTPSGSIWLMRNVTEVLRDVCMEIPASKTLTISSAKHHHFRIRFFHHGDSWTSTLPWLRDFLDPPFGKPLPRVRAAFGLSENAVVRFHNVAVTCLSAGSVPDVMSGGFFLGCTWAKYPQARARVEILAQNTGLGVDGKYFVVLAGPEPDKNSEQAGVASG